MKFMGLIIKFLHCIFSHFDFKYINVDYFYQFIQFSKVSVILINTVYQLLKRKILVIIFKLGFCTTYVIQNILWKVIYICKRACPD